jgi:hypothetical protein
MLIQLQQLLLKRTDWAVEVTAELRWVPPGGAISSRQMMVSRYRERLFATNESYLFWTTQGQVTEDFHHYQNDTLTIWTTRSNRYSRVRFDATPGGGKWPGYCNLPDCLLFTKANLLAALFYPPIEDTPIQGGIEKGMLWVSYEAYSINLYRMSVKYTLDPETLLPATVETKTFDNGKYNKPRYRKEITSRFKYLDATVDLRSKIDSFQVPANAKLLQGKNSIINAEQQPHLK